MTESLTDIFRKHMPYVDESMATSFAGGMQAYHDQFKGFRDKSINYEDLSEYQNAQQTLAEVSLDSFWVYSPHFRKTMAMAIESLFGTKITKMSFALWSDCIIFIDARSNRWVLIIDEPRTRGEGTRKISMFYPRSNTKICTCATYKSISHKTLADPVATHALAALDFDSSEFCSE